MTFPTPSEWTRDSEDVARDERKRLASPSSFFYSQGRALVTAASYFSDDRLAVSSHGAVAAKHRHRIHLALYGQLLASFEYMLKDFVARVVDTTPSYDNAIRASKWIEVDASRVLSLRMAATTPGALLIHPTQGWHFPEEVNRRFSALFQSAPIENAEVLPLERLWVLRHSVAHNAGFVIAPDAARLGAPSLKEKVAAIDAEFIEKSLEFLSQIARRLAEQVGGKVLADWLSSRIDLGSDYERDKEIFSRLKLLATFVNSRPKDLPVPTRAQYEAAWPGPA